MRKIKREMAHTHMKMCGLVKVNKPGKQVNPTEDQVLHGNGRKIKYSCSYFSLNWRDYVKMPQKTVVRSKKLA